MSQGLSMAHETIIQTFIRARKENVASLCALKRACHDESLLPTYAAILASYDLVSYDAEGEILIPPDVRFLAQTVLMGEDATISPMYY